LGNKNEKDAMARWRNEQKIPRLVIRVF